MKRPHAAGGGYLGRGCANPSLILVIVLMAVCGGPSPINAAYVYQAPRQLDDGWKVSNLSAEGMDEKLVARVTNDIMNGKYRGIDCLLIIKNGALVHEVYFGGNRPDSLHNIHSITKSVTSALIGIAIDKGFINGVDEPLYRFFPRYATAFRNQEKRAIQLQHVLTLTSGLTWDEKSYPYCDERNSECQQVRTADWMKYVVERPVVDQPGTRYVYNTGSVHLLSGVLKEATGMFADEFAEEYLFEPLGIAEYQWNTDPQGYPCTGGTHGGLRMRARDLAKFGYLFMNRGRWGGRQVVSEEWVKESTREHIDAFYHGLGYLWRTGGVKIKEKQVDHFYAAGYGGQSLTIVPELDLVILFLCWYRAEDADILGPSLMIHKAALEN